MGPNVTRLFNDAKQNLYHTEDGVNIIHREVLDARTRLEFLFSTHGEALIEALEEAFNCFLITQRVEDYPSHEWAPRVQKLLAQLEAEAQP